MEKIFPLQLTTLDEFLEKVTLFAQAGAKGSVRSRDGPQGMLRNGSAPTRGARRRSGLGTRSFPALRGVNYHSVETCHCHVYCHDNAPGGMFRRYAQVAGLP